MRWSPADPPRPRPEGGSGPRAPGSPSCVVVMRTPTAAQRTRHRLDPVRLLHAQLLRAADDALAARERGAEREERQLVDQERHLVAAPRPSRRARPRRTSRSATGSPPTVRRLKTEIRAPMRSSTWRKPVRVGLTPTPWSRSSEPGSSVAATRNGAAEEKSPGTSRSSGAQPPPAARRSAAAAGASTRAPRAGEHPLGVVAARRRLDDGRRPAVRVEPGEEHAGLHLRARHRQLVADRRAAYRRLDRGAARGRPSSRPRAHRRAAARRSARAAAGRATRRRRARSCPSCPARMPASRRISVPGVAAVDRAPRAARARAGRRPAPGHVSRLARPRPRARAIASAVESVSAERPKPRISLSPSAIAPSSSARWEIDLSPGTPKSPRERTTRGLEPSLAPRTPARR